MDKYMDFLSRKRETRVLESGNCNLGQIYVRVLFFTVISRRLLGTDEMRFH